MVRKVTNMQLALAREKGADLTRPPMTMSLPEIQVILEQYISMKKEHSEKHAKVIEQKLAKMDEVIKAIQACKSPDLKPLIKIMTDMQKEHMDMQKERMDMKTDDTDHTPCSYKVTGKRDQRGLIDLEHGLIFTAIK